MPHEKVTSITSGSSGRASEGTARATTIGRSGGITNQRGGSSSGGRATTPDLILPGFNRAVAAAESAKIANPNIARLRRQAERLIATGGDDPGARQERTQALESFGGGLADIIGSAQQAGLDREAQIRAGKTREAELNFAKDIEETRAANEAARQESRDSDVQDAIDEALERARQRAEEASNGEEEEEEERNVFSRAMRRRRRRSRGGIVGGRKA